MSAVHHYCESDKCWYCMEQLRKQPSYVFKTEEQSLFELAMKLTRSPVIMKMFLEAIEAAKKRNDGQ